MAGSEQSKVFDASVAIWEALLYVRDAFSKNGIRAENVDAALGLAFSPKEHDSLASVLKRTKELMTMASQMKEWGVDHTNIKFAMASVFKPGQEVAYGEEISRWHTLKNMRDRLEARCMKTTSIDDVLQGLFFVSPYACQISARL